MGYVLMGKMARNTDAAKNQASTKKTLKKPAAQTTWILSDSDIESSNSEEVYPIKKDPQTRKNLPRSAKNTLEEITPPRTAPRMKHPSALLSYWLLSSDDDDDKEKNNDDTVEKQSGSWDESGSGENLTPIDIHPPPLP